MNTKDLHNDPAEPVGWGQVVKVLYGQTHAVIDLQDTSDGEGEAIHTACTREIRKDRHTRPSWRFQLLRAHLSQAVSCVSCRDHLGFDTPNDQAG